MRSDILIIGDPWETLDHPRDSSLHLMAVAAKQFHLRSHWAQPNGIFLRNGVLYARTDGEVVERNIDSSKSQIREFGSFHSVHWRTDPPVTLATMRLWSLLSASGGEKGVPFVNSPHALLTWNEKFAPTRFREWAIPSLAADAEHEWRGYFESRAGKQLVAKPVGDAASRGVQLLPKTWDAAAGILRQMRAEHGAWLVLQEFDEALLSVGETRIFTLGREIVGTINKHPHPKRPIMNLDAPEDERPRLSMTEPTAEQRFRAHTIADALAAEGVYLATIDFIGDRILEINVTSPGLIAWIDQRLPEDQQIALKYWRGIVG